MANTLSGEQQNMVNSQLLFYTTLWKIVRKDGFTLRFTDSPIEIISDVDGEPQLYSPSGGFNASALSQKHDLKSNNRELKGHFDDDKISEADIRNGLYRDAEVYEYLIDSRFPNSGSLFGNKYYVGNIVFETGTKVWEWQVEGVTKFLKQKVGERFSRNCRYRFGNTRCTVDLDNDNGVFNGATLPIKSTASVTTVDNPRQIFKALSINSQYPDFAFQYGTVVWRSGSNNGATYDIARYNAFDRTITLSETVPYDIQVGDAFFIHTGCSKSTTSCKQYNNILNFGGYPFIPGGDNAIRTPRAR